MSTKLEQLRAKLKTQSQGGGNFSGDGASYPFWNIPDDGYTTIRFLPDLDPENSPFFWLESQTFRWSFPDAINPGNIIKINIPCKETWDGPKSCPIVNELRSFYKAKDPEMDKVASALWPKKSYIYEGFVRYAPAGVEQTVPDNPIRILNINKMLHKQIKESILTDNPDQAFEEMPTDFEKGTDFVIKKTKNGTYASYTTSGWSKKQSPLTDAELAAIETHKLWSLKSRLKDRPSDEAYEVAYKMFEASVNGEPWNPEWEVFFKPFGSATNDDTDALDSKPTTRPAARASSTDSAIDAVKSVLTAPADDTGSVISRLKSRSAPVEVEDAPAEEPVETQSSEPAEAPASKHSDVLARLKARREKSAS